MCVPPVVSMESGSYGGVSSLTRLQLCHSKGWALPQALASEFISMNVEPSNVLECCTCTKSDMLKLKHLNLCNVQEGSVGAERVFCQTGLLL